MSRRRRSIDSGYFEQLYARDLDPWRFETSVYERSKYDATLAALSCPRYANVLEIGCSIGVLTERLASRCDRLTSTDVSERALDAARLRCSRFENIKFERLRAPHEWPEGRFDAIVLSEVVYYFNEGDVVELANRTVEAALPGCEILLVHWTGPTDYPLSADQAVGVFTKAVAPAILPFRASRTKSYRLDLLRAVSR